MGQKEKRNSSCAMERSRTEDSTVVRNRLLWLAYTVTWGHIWRPWPLLPLKVIWMPVVWATTDAMLMSKDHAATEAILIWVPCAATRHHDIWSRAAAEGHVLVHAAGVYIYVCGLFYHWELWDSWPYGTGGLDTRELVLPISQWLPQLNWPQWHRRIRAGPNSWLPWANWPPHLLAAAIGELVPLGVEGGWPYLLPCVWEIWLRP